MTDLTGNICAAVNKEMIENILINDYGFINGQIRQLDGYDDKNFHITEVKKCTEGIEFPADGIVMKFKNSIDSKNSLLHEAQIKLTQHLEISGLCCPIMLLNKYGQSYRSLVIGNKTHTVLVYKYIKGVTLKDIEISSDVSTQFGAYIGDLTLILKKFDHKGFHRDCLIWALEKSPEVLKFVDVFDQEKQQKMIKTVLNKFQSDVLLKAVYLEKSVIHGDLSMNNIIVKNNKIHGIIDMGDVIYSFTIFDFAIALCYLILHKFEDNNTKLSDVHFKSFVDAYEKQYRRLNEFELKMLHTCVCARICQSLVLGKKSSLRDLSNLYILSTQKTGWRALEEMMNVKEDEFIKLLKH